VHLVGPDPVRVVRVETPEPPRHELGHDVRAAIKQRHPGSRGRDQQRCPAGAVRSAGSPARAVAAGELAAQLGVTAGRRFGDEPDRDTGDGRPLADGLRSRLGGRGGQPAAERPDRRVGFRIPAAIVLRYQRAADVGARIGAPDGGLPAVIHGPVPEPCEDLVDTGTYLWRERRRRDGNPVPHRFAGNAIGEPDLLVARPSSLMRHAETGVRDPRSGSGAREAQDIGHDLLWTRYQILVADKEARVRVLIAKREDGPVAGQPVGADSQDIIARVLRDELVESVPAYSPWAAADP
jgi:hypothetical protein